MLALSSNLQETIDGFLDVGPLMLISAGWLLVYTVVHNRITPFDDLAEIFGGNLATGISRGGAYMGILIAMCGTFLMNDASGYQELMVNHAANGGVVLVFFVLASFIIDRAVLRASKNNQELQDGNISVALVELCSYVSLGMIMAAAFAGDDPGVGFVMGLVNAVVFSAVGLATLMGIYTVYTLLRRGLDRRIDDHELAPGIDAGSVLVSMGFVIACSIAGDHVSWGDDLASYLTAVAIAIVVMAIARPIGTVISVLSLKALSIRRQADEPSRSANPSRSVLTAAVSIGFAAGLGALTAF